MDHLGLRLRRMLRREPWYPALAAAAVAAAALGLFPWAFALALVVFVLILLSRRGRVVSDAAGRPAWRLEGEGPADPPGGSGGIA
jgi:hypothetical protein